METVAPSPSPGLSPPPKKALPRCRIEIADYSAFLRGLVPASIDLILTDPPYTISRKTGFAKVKNGVKRFAVSMDFGQWDHAEIDLSELATHAYRALRPGGTVIVWYDLWKITPLATALVQAGFRMLRTIIWEKTNPVPLNSKRTYLSNSREIAVVGIKGSNPTFKSAYDNGVYSSENDDDVYSQPIPRHNGHRVHPTQKPLKLFSEIVEKHSCEGDVICDPFLGSGTTAVAALRLKRSFVGCDIEKKYARIAKQRVKDELD